MLSLIYWHTRWVRDLSMLIVDSLFEASDHLLSLAKTDFTEEEGSWFCLFMIASRVSPSINY